MLYSYTEYAKMTKMTKMTKLGKKKEMSDYAQILNLDKSAICPDRHL